MKNNKRLNTLVPRLENHSNFPRLRKMSYLYLSYK